MVLDQKSDRGVPPTSTASAALNRRSLRGYDQIIGFRGDALRSGEAHSHLPTQQPPAPSALGSAANSASAFSTPLALTASTTQRVSAEDLRTDWYRTYQEHLCRHARPRRQVSAVILEAARLQAAH
jgi:tryptophan 2,3-dioxygenase